MSRELYKNGVYVKSHDPKYAYDKAVIINDSHGDVLICETQDGYKFPLHYLRATVTSPWQTKAEQRVAKLEELEAIAKGYMEVIKPKIEAPKHYSNTIKRRADKGSQGKLF